MTFNEIDEEESEVIVVSEDKKLPELYPVGLLHGTYIVCENELGIYLIDQHAAKERINYEFYNFEIDIGYSYTDNFIIELSYEFKR